MDDPLLRDPAVISGIRQAWEDSRAEDAAQRHEEGGYIVRLGMLLKIQRWPRGQRGRIAPPALDDRNCYNGGVVIAAFHTHPNPPIDENDAEWEQEPSASDRRWHARRKFPGYVVCRDAVYAIDADGNVEDLGQHEQVLS